MSPCLAQDTLVVSVAEIPPWQSTISGSAEGIDIIIINKIAASLGLKVKYEFCPFKRCLKQLARGKSDIMGSLGQSKERAAYLDYLIPPYQEFIKLFYVRRGEGRSIEAFEDMHGFRIGLIRGSIHFEPFDSSDKITRVPLDSYHQLFKMLGLGRLDAVITDHIEGPYNLKIEGFEDKLSLAKYQFVTEDSGYIAMSKKSKYITRKMEFDVALKQMISSGEIDRLIKASLDNL